MSIRILLQLTLLPILIISLFSCETKPKYIIPEDEMVDILVDIHIADGVLNTESFPYDNLPLRPENFYKNILAKHQINRVLFDSALSQYLQDRPLYIAMYDKVIEKLRIKQSYVEAEQEELKKDTSKVDLFYYSFNTDYETKTGLKQKIQNNLVSNIHRSGKQAYYVKKDVYVQSYHYLLTEPVQEVEFRQKLSIWFDKLPEKFPSMAFILEKDNKMLAKQYIRFDKFVKKAEVWQDVDLNVKLALEGPESDVRIDVYIYNKPKVSFYLDDYSINIEQLK